MLAAKNGKFTAHKIVSLVQDAYINVNEVAVLTAVGNLFRTGLLSETKGVFYVEESIIEQLKPTPVVPEIEDVIEEEVVPAVAAAAAEEEEEEIQATKEPVADATPVETAIETEEAALNPETGSVKHSVAKSTTVSSAKKSVAREISESTKKSVSKTSVAKESTKKSASKASVKKAEVDAAEEDALQVIGEEAEAAIEQEI